MKLKRVAMLAVGVSAIVGLTAGTTNAVPAEGPPAEPESVNYTATSNPENTVISTDAGSMVNEDGVFKIKAVDGTTVAGTELSFRVDDFVFPIAADIAGNTATLTPKLDLEHASYKPVALPFDEDANWQSEYKREKDAWSRLGSTISMGAGLGTLIGGIGGAGIGCVLGGIAGATIASATIVGMFGPFIPAAAVGCIGGMLAAGSLGTVAGQIFVTAPMAIMAAAQYFTTINEPFTPPPSGAPSGGGGGE